MSYTTVLAIYPGERVAAIEELRNAWGSAPVIWDSIWDRFGEKRHEYDSALMAGERLWRLFGDPRLSPSDAAVFAMTLDRAYVAKADYAQAAADIKTFMAKNNVGSHWVRIADLFASDPDVPGIGFHMTSVAENPFRGDWSEDDEDYLPPDWSTVWSVYDELNKMKAAA
jgi:hypothetical protein